MSLTARFFAALLASLLAASFTALGILVLSHRERWVERQALHLNSFAAGVLIATAFVHILPESLEMNAAAPLYLLAGFLLIHIANRLVHIYACRQGGDSRHVEGVVPALGIGFHSLIDGAIYAITFNVSIFTGILAAVGMVLHELPEGIIAYTLLAGSNFGRRRARLYALGLAAFTTPLGMVLAYPFIRDVAPAVLGALLAAAGGVLVYVGATHLLPTTEESPAPLTLVALLVGVTLSLLGLFVGG